MVLEHLWSHVSQSSTVSACKLITLEFLCEAEVGELNLQIFVAFTDTQDVVQLNVAMDDAELVTVLDCIENLQHHIFGLLLSQFFAVDHALT